MHVVDEAPAHFVGIVKSKPASSVSVLPQEPTNQPTNRAANTAHLRYFCPVALSSSTTISPSSSVQSCGRLTCAAVQGRCGTAVQQYSEHDLPHPCLIPSIACVHTTHKLRSFGLDQANRKAACTTLTPALQYGEWRHGCQCSKKAVPRSNSSTHSPGTLQAARPGVGAPAWGSASAWHDMPTVRVSSFLLTHSQQQKPGKHQHRPTMSPAARSYPAPETCISVWSGLRPTCKRTTL